jgi:RNA-splicing ligase RtcB
MITMKGKYNTANVMIDQIDDMTREQIQGFLNHPAFGNTYIAIMPDCHKGAGAVIGMTMKMNDHIIPNVIGVDIGCGMLSFKLSPRDVDLPALDKFIRDQIPSGFNVNSEVANILQSPNLVPEIKASLRRAIQETCDSIELDSHRVMLSLGSLGGGNHFQEFGYDSEGNIWGTIHSGSRNFGKKIAEFYQNKAKEGLKKYFLDGAYPDLEFLPIDSKDAKDYMKAMKAAQVFASYNRYEMARRLMLFFGETEPIEFIESVHNFIDFDGRVIRKGATPANLGQKVLIPFNM